MCIKQSIIIFVLLQTVIHLSVCQNNTVSTDLNDYLTENPNGTYISFEDFPADLADRLRLLTPLIYSINNFGIQLLHQLNKKTDNNPNNIAFSPISINQIFSMITSSARNQTLNELMKTFGYSTSGSELVEPENINNAFRILLNDYSTENLEQSKRPINITLPTLVLYSTDFNIKKSFRKNLKENFKADASKVDFKNPDEVERINRFVNKSTNGLIPKLLEKLDPEVKLVLVNAFYFKGSWVNKFDNSLVSTRVFHNADKSYSNVEVMFRRNNYDFFEDSDLQMISIPYEGNASMTILLPKKHKNLNDIVKNLNIDNLGKYRQHLESAQVELYLPKFKIQSSFDLKEPITDMGVVKLFSTQANLSGISSTSTYVSDAIHKAYLDVNEEGTEAAAASGIGITTKSFNPKMKKMIIDRPFIYLLEDRLNDIILFMGLVKKL